MSRGEPPCTFDGVTDESLLGWLETERFGLSFRGYDVDQVDQFISDVMRRGSANSISSAEVRNHTFRRALNGYNVADVDAALARAATQLDSH